MFTRWLSRLTLSQGWRADLAALAYGALSAAALPPLHVIPVLLISVPALLALIDGAHGPRQAARRGWWFGFGHHLLGLYWITEAIMIEAARYWWFVPIAVPALAATLAAFIAVAAALARLASPGWPRVLALAGAWVLADLARQFVATGFPWNPWGSVWEIPGPVGDIFIQPAAWVGVGGLTFATLLLAALPVLGWRARVAGLAALIAWVAFGVVRLAAPLPAAPSLNVVLTQGNVAQGQKWDFALATQIFSRYLRLTDQGIVQSGNVPAVVVWPESASPALLQSDAPAREAIASAAHGAPSLIGSVRFDAERRVYNSLFALAGDGRIVGVYDKWHLVPFGEFQPSWIPLPVVIVPGGGFAHGSGPETLHLPGVPPVAPLICYEAVYSGQIVDEADRPAWLVNVTNDAWFGNSTGPRQHLAAARLRAVEEGLPLLRAANTGISAAFDARGHELARLGMRETGFLVVALPAALPITLYARFGLVIPGLIALLALGIGLIVRRNAAQG